MSGLPGFDAWKTTPPGDPEYEEVELCPSCEARLSDGQCLHCGWPADGDPPTYWLGDTDPDITW